MTEGPEVPAVRLSQRSFACGLKKDNLMVDPFAMQD
jgi:hypothetical protein